MATAAGLGLAVLPTTARAVSYVVTSTADTTPNGCNPAPPGGNGCTLREAVDAADASGGLDIIDATGISGTISLDAAIATGYIDFIDNIEIRGPGASTLTIEGPTSKRIFLGGPSATTVTISNVTLAGGHPSAALARGGAVNVSGDLTLDGVVVRDNSAYTGGGVSTGGNLKLIKTTLHHNSAHVGAAFFSSGDATLINSTISGNSADARGGGFSMHGNLTMKSSTVSDNSVTGGDPSDNCGGFYVYSNATVLNSIVANNTATIATEFRVQGTLSISYSLVEGVSFPAVGNLVDHNIAGQDPKLGPLGNNGGPTPTQAPLMGSRALDNAQTSACPMLDQRYAFRSVDGWGNPAVECDMGAVEYHSQAGPDFIVTESDDNGDGVCSLESCTLREAVAAANTLDNGPWVVDEITFDDGVATTLGGSEIPISDEIAIRGQDQWVSGNNQSRIFSVDANASELTLSGILLTRGHSTGDGGALYAVHDLVLDDVTISHSHADGKGGGFYVAQGDVTLVESAVSDNDADDAGGGFYLYGFDALASLTSTTVYSNFSDKRGGGFDVAGHASLVNSVVESNSSGNGGGGGFATSHGDNQVIGSTIRGNHANNGGGGGFAMSNGDLTLTNTTVSGNTASARGGGVFLSVGFATVVNSTISDNHAYAGGGMTVFDGATLTHTTVVGNESFGSGVNPAGGGGIMVGLSGSDPLTLNNSIVADNTVNGGTGPDIWNGAVTADHSLVGVANVGPTTFTNVGGTFTGTAGSPLDPALDVLADNGGPTETHMPLPTSPVIDNGSVTLCLAGDQRGAIRPVDGDASATAECDIGAVEVGGQASPFVVTSNVDPGDGLCTVSDCTLREAVDTANGNENGPFMDVVTFAPAVTGSIDLTAGELFVGEDLAIQGPGVDVLEVDAGYASRILASGAMGPVELAISDISLVHGATVDPGGAINAYGNLVLDHVKVLNSLSGDLAGGVLVQSGDLSLTDSAISGNASQASAGGVYVYWGSMTMIRSSISDNSADGGAGGFVVYGDVDIDSSTISGNRAGLNPASTFNNFGGGVAAGRVRVLNSTISGNSTTGSVGGMGAYEGLYLLNTTVTDNHAGIDGGGLAAETGGVPIELVNSIVAGNTAGGSGPDIYAGDVLASFSLVGVSDDGPAAFDGGSFSLVGTLANPLDPELAPLADNGGPTWTHALEQGSPAVDSAWNDPCVYAPLLSVDQRGLPRPFDGDNDGDADCDMGAFELQYSDIIFRDNFGY